MPRGDVPSALPVALCASLVAAYREPAKGAHGKKERTPSGWVTTQPQAGRSRELIPTPRQGLEATSVATETELEPAPQGARVGAPQRSKRDPVRPLRERIADLTPKQGRG